MTESSAPPEWPAAGQPDMKPAGRRRPRRTRRRTARTRREPTRRPWWHPAPAAAVLVGAAGVGYRIWVTVNHYPRFDSDEAAMGLGALHIAAGSDFPVFLYGQHYMGAVESYLAAPFVAVFGPTVAALRVPQILLFGGFLAAMYRLTVRLYGSAWFGAVVVGVLSLGSDRVLKDELVAHGGSAEIKPLAAALFLLALAAPGAAHRKRVGICVAFGVVAGLALWSHWLILPYLLAAAVLLAWSGRRWISRWHLLGLTAGLLAGAAPLIGYNLGAAPGQDSVSIFLRLTGGEPTELPRRLVGGVLLGVPLATGACNPGGCTPWQRCWAVVYLALVAVSATMTVRLLRRTGQGRATELAALLLLLAAVVSILAYVRSPAAGRTPIESARYLSCLPVSTPAILWPGWAGLRAGARAAAPAVFALAVLSVALLGATATAAARAVPDARKAARDQSALLAALRRERVDGLYSGYWTCNRISYLSGERTVCATLDEGLRPGLDRWLPYRAQVANDPRPAYAFPAGSDVDRAFRVHLAHLGVPVVPLAVGGYHLYRPPRPVPLPG